ncbi:hypothetical protein [Clavibacter tessellarius]|uniref:hypothetical protein n=1 Tax=Clavibacter tessellarius TaxID=31965 RepID=UPI00324ACC4C
MAGGGRRLRALHRERRRVRRREPPRHHRGLDRGSRLADVLDPADPPLRRVGPDMVWTGRIDAVGLRFHYPAGPTDPADLDLDLDLDADLGIDRDDPGPTAG